MTAHSERDHATWSASAAKGNMACAGRIAMTKDLPESTNEAADWGTCAHQISEACLRDGGDADRFIGTIQKGKKYEFEVDEEMADTAQEYIDYVRKQAADGVDLWIEEKFSFAELKPPFDSGGTGDAVIYKPALRELEVVDLKGGRGVVVEAKGNPQGRSYGLGALLAHPGLDVQTIKVTIVQPRAPHKEGRIRSDVFSVAELLDWTVDMLAAMKRSREALDNFPGFDDAKALEAWADVWLTPGDHCKDTFCKAHGFCPAAWKKAEADADLYFDPVTSEPKSGLSPMPNDPDERARRLDMVDFLEGLVKAIRAEEHRQAEMGNPAPGWCLVDKTGREKFVDAEAERKALAAAKAAGLEESAYLNPGKLKTPKQVKAAMKKAGADLSALEGLSKAESSGTNLVRQDGTIREAIAPVDQHFEAI